MTSMDRARYSVIGSHDVTVLNQLTNFCRTAEELQWFWLFSVFVPNPAEITMQKVDSFLRWCDPANCFSLPFDKLRFILAKAVKAELDTDAILRIALQQSKTGQYRRLVQTLNYTLNKLPPLSSVTLEDLESCPGVGPKTARFFLLHSQPDQRFAAIDTHLLKFLGDLGHKVPKATPNGSQYRRLELAFLEECDRRGLRPADLDFQVWKAYRENNQQVLFE